MLDGDSEPWPGGLLLLRGDVKDIVLQVEVSLELDQQPFTPFTAGLLVPLPLHHQKKLGHCIANPTPPYPPVSPCCV